MTKVWADEIKAWRIRGCTWRKIAELAAEKWPELEIIPGNQIDGQTLCDMAMKKLGESAEDGW